MKLDIKKVLKSFKPGAEKVPGLVCYLRRLAHEDELNYFLEHYSDRGAVDFIRACLKQMKITHSQVGMEKLDPKGRYIFASNHPFGGLDGIMLADAVSAYFGDVRVVVNDLLMNIPPLQEIFIPVNKYGAQNIKYSNRYNDAFESDIPIITFPAGLVSRRKKGVIADSEWKHSFVRQAISTQRDIVPVYFSGKLSNFFYRLANLRTGLGIKVNFEMIYLADEMFKQADNHFDIKIGDPISYLSLEEIDPRKATKMIREKAYNLKNL